MFVSARHIPLLFAMLLLFGCSSTGQLGVRQELVSAIDHGADASLSVAPHEKVEKDEAVDKAVRMLRSELYGRLMSDGVFRVIMPPGESARYEVQVRMIVAKEVSQTARILFGVLAGKNELVVEVDVYDTLNNVEIVSFTAKGISASHPLSSENSMADAIREAVDEIILELGR